MILTGRLVGLHLEEFLFTGSDGSLSHVALDDLKSFGDLVGVGRGAVLAEEELSYVGGHRVLALELLGKVLLDEVAVEVSGGELVKLVDCGHVSLPMVTCR